MIFSSLFFIITYLLGEYINSWALQEVTGLILMVCGLYRMNNSPNFV